MYFTISVIYSKCIILLDFVLTNLSFAFKFVFCQRAKKKKKMKTFQTSYPNTFYDIFPNLSFTASDYNRS